MKEFVAAIAFAAQLASDNPEAARKSIERLQSIQLECLAVLERSQEAYRRCRGPVPGGVEWEISALFELRDMHQVSQGRQ